MLKKQSIEAIKAMGIDYDALVSAIKDTKEVDLTLPEGTFYTEDAINELRTNIKRGHEEAYTEIWGKSMNEKHALGLSTRDAKNPEKVIAALKSKGAEEANVEPNTKIKELEESIKRLQTETIPEKERQYAELETKYKGYLEREQYISVLPKDAISILTPDEHIARVKQYAIRGENGEAIDPKTGIPFKDKMERPIPFTDKVNEFYKNNPALLQTQQQNTDTGKKMHHSTNGKQVGQLDMTKVTAEIQGKYDMNDHKQRAQARAEITAAMVNNAQANTA